MGNPPPTLVDVTGARIARWVGIVLVCTALVIRGEVLLPLFAMGAAAWIAGRIALRHVREEQAAWERRQSSTHWQDRYGRDEG
jgi:hypothetical protein